MNIIDSAKAIFEDTCENVRLTPWRMIWELKAELIAIFAAFLLLLVFIMQNTDTTTVHLFGWSWNLPVGVAILFAAVGGGLVTVAAGTVRIFQLRRAAKKSYKAASR